MQAIISKGNDKIRQKTVKTLKYHAFRKIGDTRVFIEEHVGVRTVYFLESEAAVNPAAYAQLLSDAHAELHVELEDWKESILATYTGVIFIVVNCPP